MHVAILPLCALLSLSVASAASLPFKFTDYRIPDANTILLLADHAIDASLGMSVEVALKGASAPLTTATLVRSGVRSFTLSLGQPLGGGQNYELRLVSDTNSSVTIGGQASAGPFTAEAFSISTKPSATIEPSYVFEELGEVFFVKSKVALAPLPPHPEFNLLDYTGAVKKSLTVAAFTLQTQTGVTTGWAKVVLADGLPQQSARLQAIGLTNIFGAPVMTEPAAIGLAPLPKDKADATVYLKISHQGGTGYPAWVLNGKLAPATGRSFGGGWRFVPSLDVDIGNRSVGSTKSNDVIKPALGLSQFFRFGGFIEGARLRPSFSYETNRGGTTGNVLGDIDGQFMVRGLYHPMSYSQRQKWLDAVNAAIQSKANGQDAITDIKLDEITVPFGWGIQFFLGTEIGGATNERTAKATKGTAGTENSNVELPKFTVTRFRPKARAFIEVRRITLDATITPRYLFAREYYAFESADSKRVYLGDIKGWASYIEPTLSIRLDQSGHISLSGTWKHGIVPPSYVRANTVQSGLEFKF